MVIFLQSPMKCCFHCYLNKRNVLIDTCASRPVFVEYIFLKMFNVSSLRLVESKNFGLSGHWYKHTNIIPLKRLLRSRQMRHGNIVNPNISKSHFCGMMVHVSNDKKMEATGENMVTDEQALVRVASLWNSLMYEKVAAWTPAVLYTISLG